MRKPKSYSVLELLNYSDVGLIWEFYSTKNTDFIISDLSNSTSKNIILTNDTIFTTAH